MFGLTMEDFVPQVEDIISVGEFYEQATGGRSSSPGDADRAPDFATRRLGSRRPCRELTCPLHAHALIPESAGPTTPDASPLGRPSDLLRQEVTL
jgi:hypothetical protein